MRKQILLLLPILFFFIKNGNTTGDSLRYLTPKDTVFLKIDRYNEKVFEHTLEKGQTLYSLSKFYGMATEELFFYNTHINPAQVSVGTKVKVPIPNRALIRRPEHTRDTSKFVPVFHRIRKGETLYRLTTLYYKIPMDTLKNWNGLTSNVLQPDQPIYIGMMSIEGVPDSFRMHGGSFWWKRNYELGKQFRARSGGGKVLKKDKGAAFWNKKNGRNTDELFALHRSAPVGTLILVKNPMTRSIAFVRVLGRIPEAKYPPNAKIVLSEKTAKLLGARDKKFFVEFQYWR